MVSATMKNAGPTTDTNWAVLSRVTESTEWKGTMPVCSVLPRGYLFLLEIRDPPGLEQISERLS